MKRNACALVNGMRAGRLRRSDSLRWKELEARKRNARADRLWLLV